MANSKSNQFSKPNSWLNDYQQSYCDIGEVFYNFKCEEVVFTITGDKKKNVENRQVCYDYAKVKFENKTQCDLRCII